MSTSETTASLAGYATRWDDIGPPLRPTAAVAGEIAGLVQSDGPVLLLGVTPEFHGIWDNLVAVDSDPVMVTNVWPGDGNGQHAMVANWMEMDWPDESFGAIICDGGLGLLGSIDSMTALHERCLRWLVPGGKVVHRLFCRTAPSGQTARSRMSDALSGPGRLGFHGFKMLCNFARADHLDSSLVAFSDLHRWFNDMFPDRDRLCAETGWDRSVVDTIDLYKGNPASTMFCTWDEYMGSVPDDASDVIMHTPNLGYDLWDWCPLLTVEK